MADLLFEDKRLAALYDPLDPDRSDLDSYLRLAQEFEAHSVLDIGCGTGTLACLLALRGHAVTAVDPAAASLEQTRRYPSPLAPWRRASTAGTACGPGDDDRQRRPGVPDGKRLVGCFARLPRCAPARWAVGL